MSRELTLFDAQDQVANLERVKSNLLKHVLDFCRNEVLLYFTIRQLVKYCMVRTDCSPESPSRILRNAKEDGLVNYKCVNRAQSQYRLNYVWKGE